MLIVKLVASNILVAKLLDIWVIKRLQILKIIHLFYWCDYFNNQ